MKDRYLFKAKRKDNGEWIEGYYVELFNNKDKQKSYRIYTGYAEKDTDELFEEYYEVIPETVSQYTGLKDKNGVKIFENDIVKMQQMNFESEWEDSWGTLHHDYDEVNITMTMDFAYTYQFTGEYLDDIERIGNKFDEEVK